MLLSLRCLDASRGVSAVIAKAEQAEIHSAVLVPAQALVEAVGDPNDEGPGQSSRYGQQRHRLESSLRV